MVRAMTLDAFVNYPVVSLDFETISLENKKVELFSLAAVDGDWRNPNDIVFGVFFPDQLQNLAKFLPGKRIVFHNFKFDGQVIIENGMDALSFRPEDTSIMAMLLDEEGETGLKMRAKTDLGMQMTDWNQEMVDRFRAGDQDEYINYSGQDAIATIRLFWGYRDEIIKQKLVTAYMIEMKAAVPIMFMEINGIGFDHDRCDRLKTHARDRRLTLEDSIFNGAGRIVQLTKPKPLAEYLYDDLGIPYRSDYGRKMKTATRSTAKEVIDQIIDDLDDDDFRKGIVKEIKEWKRVQKLESAFFDQQKEAALSSRDGKIHANFNQLTIITGRIAVSAPNLNQLPTDPIIPGDIETNIRKMYVPGTPGNVFIDSDYSQIELRMMAHMSNDLNMIHAFQNDIDIHQMTADLCGIPRKKAKIANFGKQYGMTPPSFARVAKMTVPEAKAFYSTYDSQFPGTVNLRKEVLKLTLDKGYIRMLGGRKRRVQPYFTDWNTERNMVSALIQGSAGIVLKLALIKLFDRFKNKDAQIILTVHDELLLESHPDFAPEVQRAMVEDMESAVQLRVPLAVDPKIGKTFGDFKE